MYFFHDLREAQAPLQEALALDPNSAYAHNVSCWLANILGKSSEAVDECRKAVELDPLSLRLRLVTGNYKGAIEQWIKNEELLGNEQRAKDLRKVFEKSGYSGYLRKDATNKEDAGDFYDAASDYALLGERDAALTTLQKAAEPANRFLHAGSLVGQHPF